MPSFMGYADPKYALSMSEFGELRELPRCGGWMLVRPIFGTRYKDAMGCYPLFACRDWTRLHEDLERVSEDIVSLSLVTDPFCKMAPEYLQKHFDLVKPFKTHYVTDLGYPLESIVNKDYRYNARKSLKAMDIEICGEPAQYVDEWTGLYGNLINRHGIKGLNAFSRKCFEIQLNVPGMFMILGRREGEIIGATILLIGDHEAYTHLSAFTSIGYKIHAAYGIRWKAFAFLQERGIRYLDNGGGAGIKDDPRDGLAQFKRGWSNGRRTVYFCGRIFHRQGYDDLCRKSGATNVDYFPAYRAAEFGWTGN
jgi:hypothetical protein